VDDSEESLEQALLTLLDLRGGWEGVDEKRTLKAGREGKKQTSSFKVDRQRKDA
jgi:hypothetical protein